MKTKTLYFLLLIAMLHIGVHNVAAQIIWNQTLPNTIGSSPIALQASVYNSITGYTDSSFGAVMFTTNNANVAKLSGSNLPVSGYYNGATLTIVGAGTATITATDYSGAFAMPVSKIITVPKQSQQIAWNNQTLSGTVGGQIPLTATAPGGTVTYTSSNSNIASVSGSTLTCKGAGSATITASQAGNANYNAAPNATKNFTVAAAPKQNQTITWNQTLSGTVGNPIQLTATAPGGTVTYTSSNSNIASVSGSTLTCKGAGSATITASQAGNTNYNAAANVQKNITVAAAPKQNQTITWSQNNFVATYGDQPITLNAYASSTLPILYYTDDPNIATAGGTNGNTLYFNGVGTTTIYAVQPGNDYYNPTNILSRSITVNQAVTTKTNQTITWNQTFSSSYNVGDPPISLTATASSNLQVSYTSSDISVATITNGNILNFVGVGSAIITASQSGNANYYAATNVTKTITVTQNSQNQDSYFQPDPTATYYIVHYSGFYLDAGTFPINGANYNNVVYITVQDYSPDQEYKFVPVQGKNGVYNIMQVSSGLYICSAYISTVTDFLGAFTDDGNMDQFQMKSTGTGYYTITRLGNTEPNSYWGTDSNTNSIIVWTNKDGTNSLDYWYFVEASGTSINPVVTSNTAIAFAKDGLLTINHLTGTNRIYIYTIAGQLMDNSEVKSSDYTKALPTGSYVVVVKGDSSYRGVVIVK